MSSLHFRTRYILRCFFAFLLCLTGMATLHGQTQLTGSLINGLVAYYPLNGDAMDATGNGNTGIETNVTYTSDRFSSPGSAVKFSTTSSVEVPSLQELSFRPVTYSMWIKFDQLPLSGNATTLIGRMQTWNQEDGALTIVNGIGYNNELCYYTGGDIVGSGFHPQVNEWCHITFAYTSEGMVSFYINGSLSASISFTPPQSTGLPFIIGASSILDGIDENNTHSVRGSIDDVRIYNRALSTAEVQQLYASENNTPLADFSYSTNNGAVTITGYTGTRGAITIPSSIEGYPVTSIGDAAFQGHSTLTSVTIPGSVTSIGSGAFNNCAGLTGVTIPSSVTSIGDYAFANCSNLTSVTIPNSVTSIGSLAFYSCSGLTSLTIGSGVSSIGELAFFDNSGLTSVMIPDSVTSIGNNAFYFCTRLTSVTAPDRFLAALATIGIPGPIATKMLMDGIANNLSTNTTFINALTGNDAFVTAVANKIKSTSGNYGIATQSALSSALTESRADGINSVLSNPSLWTLYTTSQIQNMAVGDLVLTKNVGGSFTLNYDIEQSSDLKTWTPYQALSLPLTGLPTDKAFVRIKVKP